MDSDAEMILTKLKAFGGTLPFNDNSDPEKIKDEFKISKNAFKRAIGKLYKAGSIVITEDGIRLS
jgi:predicted RNA-binding protein (virulence factor B family)